MKNLNNIIFKSTPMLYVALLFHILATIANNVFSLKLGVVSDVAYGKEDFWGYVVTLVMFFILYIVLMYIQKYLRVISFAKINYNIKNILYKSIQKKDMGEFMMKSEDEYIGMLINDTKMLESQYVIPLWFSILCIIEIVITLISLCLIDIKCAIFILIISIFSTLIPMLFNKKLQKRMKEYSDDNSRFISEIILAIDGYETYTNYDAYDFVKSKFEKNQMKNIKKYKKAYDYLDLMMSTLMTMSNVVVLGILLVGMVLALKGKISIGTVFALQFLGNNLVNPIGEVARYFTTLLGTKEIVGKFDTCIKDYDINKHERVINKVNSIEIKNLKLQLEGKNIINNVNIKFEKAKKYAIVGESGSGKSTLIKLILGCYKEYQGEIYYNDICLRDINKNSIYNEIIYLPQEVNLFKGTLRENLTMFNTGYADVGIYKVLEIVNMLDKVKELEKGLDTKIDYNGNIFSGGEKQRIAIARAFLKGKRFYVMDEATSALDYNNYINIEKLLLSVCRGTIISVTHRLSREVLNNYDEIIVMKDGQIVECGTFDELEKSNGYFMEVLQRGTLNAV